MAILRDLKKIENLTIYGVFTEYVPQMITLEKCDSVIRNLSPEKRLHLIKHIMKQICNALNHLHARGIAYRDLKPENIMIDPKTCKIKILDFGLIRFMKNKSGRTSTMTGTLGFMAPEVYIGKPYNPFKTDMYNLGVLLHLLTFDELID